MTIFTIISKGEILDPTQGVFVNPELRENYGLKVGDTLELRVKGKQHQIKIHRRSEERRVGKECRSRWSP